jgi:glycosyltransferase involved in cell wall biosynthesis
MRILYVAPWVTVGGADRATIDWLRTLPDEFRSYLLTTQPSDNALFGEAEQWAHEAWCLPELMPGADMPAFVHSFVAARQIDAVHVMNSKLGFDLLPSLRRRYPQLRTVVQLHAEEPEQTGYPPYVATRFDNWIDAYSVVSENLRDRLLEYGVPPHKLHVIHLGVDLDAFDPGRATPAFVPPEGQFPILYPHRLVDQKDPLLMVAVVAALRDGGSRAVVHVVGDGPLRAEIVAAVERAALEDRVVLHGPQQDVRPWYAATAATLLTSRFEGIPLVAYEAMAMRRPVVAPDVNGTHELVDGRSGFLISQRDSVAEYVSAILRLEREPGLAEKLGAAGRQRIGEDFTLDRMASRHQALYRELAIEFLAGRPDENP